MLAPNDQACEVMLEHGASAATDVTGFGLLGHLHEMAVGAGLAAELDFAAVPVLAEALALAEAGVFPGGARTNLMAYAEALAWDGAMAEWQRLLLADPQTSGGLLIAFPAGRASAAVEALAGRGLAPAVIGCLIRHDPGTPRVRLRG
jgi:selenide,water dikinase